MLTTLADLRTPLTIGLMSGTSLDGVDGVILALPDDGPPRVMASEHLEMPDDLRRTLRALNQPGENELHRASLAANHLVWLYAQVVKRLLASSGLTPQHIRAIGAHGQTVRHCPDTGPEAAHRSGRPVDRPSQAYTLQLNNPAWLAEATGITVVADFRSRDVAAGGQGAPLVPAFHAAVFASDRPTAVVNVGGIANVTLLGPAHPPQGFDTGPGNVLMDGWCQRHRGLAYDAGGTWAATGQPVPALLAELTADPFFQRQGPRSTGVDRFNLDWLDQHLGTWLHLKPEDVQATLLSLTAGGIARAIPQQVSTVVVCGGGALNTQLLAALQAQMAWARVSPSSEHGIPVMDVEAAAFAWLAQRTLNGQPGNVVEVTGATGPRILGAIYPA